MIDNDDYEVMAKIRDRGDAIRGYSVSGPAGFIQSVEGRSVMPPVVSEIDTLPDTDTRNVLIGYSLLFKQIIRHPDNGTYMYVLPTAFEALMLGEVKYFQHHHQTDMRVASTKDLLTLHADEYGIAFKLYIPQTALGRLTRDFVRTNVKQAMSAGFTATEIEKREIDGVEISIVVKAELLEISLCETGANSDAFAVLVEDSAEWVTDMCRSNRMNDEMDRAHIKRAMRRLETLRHELLSAPG
jgi:HK97 family phage prohead protease